MALGPGHTDTETGVWIYGEDDYVTNNNAPSGAPSFSELLNLGQRGLITAVKGVAARITTAIATAVPPAIATEITSKGLLNRAQVDEALVEHQVIESAATSEDAFSVKFDDGAVFVHATETNGIDSRVQAPGISIGPTPIFRTLDDDDDWRWRFEYADGEIALGQYANGTHYPAAGGGGIPVVPTTLAPVCIFGDSLAEAYVNPAAELATLLGRTVRIDGVGGQDTPKVIARQGGAPTLLTLAGNTMPAAGTVDVTAKTVGLLDRVADGTKTTVGVLAGVAGTLSATRVTATGGAITTTYTFTRTTAGAAFTVPPASPFTTGYNNRDALPIFITGRNDIGQGVFRVPLDTILKRIDDGLKWSNRRDRALVMSVLPRADEESIGQATRVQLDTLNDAIRTTFPTHWLDWGAYLRSDIAFTNAGVAKTAQDTTDIANGLTPSSLRTDIVHITPAAYKAANALINLTYTARDWKTTS